MTKKRLWSQGDVDLLRALYADTPTADIARRLDIKVRRVYFKAAKLGLKKSADFLASPAACRLRRGDNPGKDTRFKPGQKAWNKGLKGLSTGGEAGWFKPGNRSGSAVQKYKPIGTERISKDGYLERKTNDDLPMQRRWRAVHLINWEAANGPVPKGCALVFKDGDKRNLSLTNLELVSRKELMRRNSYHTQYPKEVARLVQLRGAITRQLNRRKKQA